MEVTRSIDICQSHGLDLAKLAPPNVSKIVLNILPKEENAYTVLAIILDFVELLAE